MKINDGALEVGDMSMKSVFQGGALVLLAACAAGAGADDKSEYKRRAAARDLSLFQSLDRNTDGAVTRQEAHGDINFLPRFNDMDIDMDGVVTTVELHRYLEQQYGARNHAQR
jgi:Ca2+-binding EF-hand superfamily protein